LKKGKRGSFIPPFWFVIKMRFCLKRLLQSFFWGEGGVKTCRLEHQGKKERGCSGRGEKSSWKSFEERENKGEENNFVKYNIC